MLSTLLLLLFSASTPANGTEGRFPEAVEVFRCRFDADSDKDFDAWPDGWTRQKGYGYPAYTKIQIQPVASPGGANCLQVDLDGGGAAVFTPPIVMDIHYCYEVEAYVRTEGLKHDGVYLSLTFLDAEKQTLSTVQSEPVTDSQGWKKIRLGTIESSQPDARWIVLGLHVEPGDEADLRGTICFSDVWLGRLPRLEMKTNQPHNFFLLPEQAKITCTASGMDDRFLAVAFELLDVFGQSLLKETRPLIAEPHAENFSPQAETAPASASASFTAEWMPPLPRPGFYRIRVALEGKTSTSDRREITLVTVEPRRPQADSIFGWSLPQGAKPLAFSELPYLLEQAGIGWAKLPVWSSEQDGGRRFEQILLLIDKLNETDIKAAAMLLEPPEPAREKFPGIGPLTAAEVFGSEPANWFPSLEPVMIQLSNKVRCWQLGRDTDQSLLSVPNFSEKMTAIRTELDRAMQGLKLGIGWNWMQGLPSGPAAADLPWNIVSLASNPPLSESELEVYLDADRQSALKRWVVIEPLGREEYPLEKRAEDLVKRMLVAKIHGADAAFCPDPFDPKHGLMNPDGTPGELFIPWRTTALEIGGAEFLGEMVLPRDSRNWVFLREKDAVMYVWNHKPVDEVHYLGEKAAQTTIWGKSDELPKLDWKQLVEVGRQPTFVTGIDKAIAQWSVGLRLEKTRLPSLFGQPLANGITVKNPLAVPIQGRVRIATPQDWIVEPREIKIQCLPGEKLTLPFNLFLLSTVGNGRKTVRFDFELEAEQPYKFSVYRHLDVGTDDVHIEFRTRLNARGELEVEQRFVNETNKPANFRCELVVPGRRRLTSEIHIPKRGEETQTYRLEDGAALLGGQLWLRAEELDGSRMLNYRFEAKK